MQVKLPADVAVDAEVDLANADGAYFLQARLNVGLPGLERATVQALMATAHKTCRYSKMAHGNINLLTTPV